MARDEEVALAEVRGYGGERAVEDLDRVGVEQVARVLHGHELRGVLGVLERAQQRDLLHELPSGERIVTKSSMTDSSAVDLRDDLLLARQDVDRPRLVHGHVVVGAVQGRPLQLRAAVDPRHPDVLPDDQQVAARQQQGAAPELFVAAVLRVGVEIRPGALRVERPAVPLDTLHVRQARLARVRRNAEVPSGKGARRVVHGHADLPPGRVVAGQIRNLHQGADGVALRQRPRPRPRAESAGSGPRACPCGRRSFNCR